MNALLLLPAGLLAGAALLLPAAPDADVPGSAPVSAASAPVTWKIDPTHTTVGFRIKHMEASWFHGRFNEVSGTVIHDVENPAGSSITFEIATASVDTNHKDRDDHLRNADFFNAKVHPKISFRSTEIAAAGKDQVKVKGLLALHGVEKELEFTADMTGTGKAPWGELIGFEAGFTIQRSEFGITAYPGALGEDVRVNVAIEAIKQ